MQNGYDLSGLLQDARSRWLKPDQLLFIIQNHHPCMIQERVLQKPPSGSLFLFNRRNVHFFRQDGHNWEKRPNRNTVKEGHENLKVGNDKALACYYAQGADNPNFRRRIYWMLENKDIVLVHYLGIAQGKTNQIPPSSSDGSCSVEDDSRVVHVQQTSVVAAKKTASSLEDEMRTDGSWEILNQFNWDGTQSISLDGVSIYGTLQYDGMASGLTDPLSWQTGVRASQNLEECLGRNNIPDSYPGQAQMPREVDPTAPQIPEQKFIITKISPDWCFADEITEVIVVGTFSCGPSVTVCAVFGNIPVPAYIIQDGVICCQTPSNCPGKVTFYITSGNWDYDSEVKEFEFRDRNSIVLNKYAEFQQQEDMEEGKLLVEFVGMLLSGSSRMQKGYEYSTDYNTEALLIGHGTSFGIIDRVLQEVLKDKLRQWLAVQFLEADKDSSCILSKKERGIIHCVAGLGYEWALNPILDVGVGVNFRDANGWTALHWAARFGREDMVSALIARGASVSAVTDPTAQDPMGKNAASVADENGHTGLAAYLSSSELTSRLSAFGFKEAEVEVSNTLNENQFSACDEDEIWMKQVLEANEKVSNSAQLIQPSFRVHSYRRRKQRVLVDEYGLTSDETHRLSAAVFSRSKKNNVGAVTIQKYYRGWKWRTHFLRMRRKVVEIQAHVRGRRVRKYYRVIRVVSVMEKIMLRWRLKRRGLRGFKLIPGEAMDENEEDEDIIRDFGKKKLDTTVNEALKRIRNLGRCRQARSQFSRMLHAYRVAKAKLGVSMKQDAMEVLNGVAFGDDDTADVDTLQDRPPASPDCLGLLSSELP